MLVEGLFIPIPTPFYSDGRLYLRKLEHNAEHYSRTPASGLAALTLSGEHEMLSDAERRFVLKAIAEAARPESLLLADVSRPSVRETLQLAEEAAELKYDAALLRMPNSANLQTQRTYLQAVADGSPISLVVMAAVADRSRADLLAESASLPQVLGCAVTDGDPMLIQSLIERTRAVDREVTVKPTFETVGRRVLEQKERVTEPNYVAVEALTGGATTGPITPPARAIKTRTKRVGFQVLAGETTACLSMLRAGARGALLPFAACAPQACYEILAAWKDGDDPLAQGKQERVQEAARFIEGALGPAGIKAACDLNGYYGGRARLPGLPLLGDEQREVQRLMRGMRS